MEGILNKIINSKSKTLLAFCFCFLFGVVLMSAVEKYFDFVFIYFLFFLLVAFLIIYWNNKKARFAFFCLVFFIMGISRVIFAYLSDSENNIAHYIGEKKKFTAVVSAEPDVRQDSVRYIVRTGLDMSVPIPVHGKIYLKYDLYPRYAYGDILEIECNLEKPEPIEDFRYDKYLARFGVFTICNKTKITKIGEGGGSRILASIFYLKNKVAERINKLWHDPYAGLVAGFLYGYRGGLGKLNDAFSRTGITHIIAISGYNITIIATVLITIFIHLYIPRKKAFYLITAGIIVFMVFTGLSPSVARAGIMGIVVLLAQQLGRLSRMENALALTAVLMSLQNPFVILYDPGFQLSFLATLGLIYIAPFIKDKLSGFPELFGIRDSFAQTISAIIATLPLILYQFGHLSIVAPLVNVLILWLVPFIMLFGFLAVILSFAFFPLGEVVAWITWAGLKYIIVVIKWFAGLDWAAVDLRIPVWVMVMMYGGMIYWTLSKLRKYKQNTDKIQMKYV